MKKTLIGLLLLLPSLGYSDNCDKPSNNFDGLYCLNKAYIQADDDLNEAYKKLKAYVSESERTQLKNDQLAWIEDRNKKCSYHDDDRGFFVNLACATDTTIERTHFLNDRMTITIIDLIKKR